MCGVIQEAAALTGIQLDLAATAAAIAGAGRPG